MFEQARRPRMSPAPAIGAGERGAKFRRPLVSARADESLDEQEANELGVVIGKDLPQNEMTSGELGPATRDVAERYLGVSLEGTLLRGGVSGAAKARAHSALAVAEGNEVSFEENQLSGRLVGRNLVGHELTHVAQQRARGQSFAQASELSAQLNHTWRMLKRKGLIFDELRSIRPGRHKDDADTKKWLADTFGTQTDDFWLASQLLQHGPEPLWPDEVLTERHRRSRGWAPEKGAIGAEIAVTPEKKYSVRAFFFPGRTDQRALVISGVHGSELSAIELAEQLIEDLKKSPPPLFSVIVVPTLFPESREAAEAQPKEIGSGKDIGRNLPSGLDPQRNQPKTGTDFDPAAAKDASGRDIVPENRALLALIDRFKPTRIASLHAAKSYAGVFADPRTTKPADPEKSPRGEALGFAPDEALALRMARTAQAGGANVKSNRLGKTPTAVYPLDPAPVAAGKPQPRASEQKPGVKHQAGVSLGEYASTATPTRAAMTMITVEVATARRIQDMPEGKAQEQRRLEIAAHSQALREIFLGEP
ncbi:MAG TPA: DUF4157 domain-containing protein [Polyangiaceae bacterium]